MLERWNQPNGYRQVLAVSLPLVATMGSITLMQFTDRIFLAGYSLNAISAALPAGIVAFAALSFFMGLANYTNAFVAQYTGAGAHQRVGAVLWQGVYFSLASAVVLASLCLASGWIFDLIGHSPPIRRLEVAYFDILVLGSGLTLLSSTLACFYTGRGLTRTVMVVHLVGAAVNIPLDYCLINGAGPFPALGIVGAGIATVIGQAVICLTLVTLVLRPANRARFGTWRQRGFDRPLFGRLIRFGLPSGVQFLLEIAGFTYFIQVLGRIGDLELAVSNIVLSIESISFMPMVGFNIGVATLVGQAVGRGQAEQGAFATTSTLHLVIVYMLLLAGVFVFLPGPLLALFAMDSGHPERSAQMTHMGVVLLRFVAVFSFFDAINLTFSGAIKGAGDTRFIMWTISAISIGVMIVPVYVAVVRLGAGLYTAWTLATVYIAAMGVAFGLRYASGRWKRMRVIEQVPEGAAPIGRESNRRGDKGVFSDI